jgi:uncharacterized protein (DUF302 family)
LAEIEFTTWYFLNKGDVMFLRGLLVLVCALHSGLLSAQESIVSVASSHSVADTASRLEVLVTEKGMTVFNRVKHSEAAQKVDIVLRPSELLIFGNPKLGSKLMQCQQSIGLDLPLKALISEDEKGQVWISYTEPKFLKKKHNVAGCDKVFSKMEKALSKMTSAAAGV